MISAVKEAVIGGDRYFQQDDQERIFWAEGADI